MKFPISCGLHSISVEFDMSAASDSQTDTNSKCESRERICRVHPLTGELSFKFVFATLFFPVPLKTADPLALLSVGIIVKLYYWCSFCVHLQIPPPLPLPPKIHKVPRISHRFEQSYSDGNKCHDNLLCPENSVERILQTNLSI